jgi:hypothetical protein
MFKIIVIGGPAENYAEQCIISILNQKHSNWEAQVIIDPIDSSYELIKKYENNKLKIHKNLIRSYALSNIVDAINGLKPKEDDILVFIDLDDWLAHRKVLSILEEYYIKNKNLLVTYGSWRAYPIKFNYPNNSISYTQEEFKNGIRNAEWKGTALRTMKYGIWNKINNDDLRDKNGNYFKTAWDVSIMMPVLEMAGFKRSKFIEEILYVYNKITPFNDHKLYLNEQKANKSYICSLPSYNLL